MPVLVGNSFAATFVFGRPNAAERRMANGETTLVAANLPRFNHDPAGNRLGLLIEAGSAFGQQDQLTPITAEWAEPGDATVLMEWLGPDGTLYRRANYTKNPVAAVDAALSTIGHLRKIGAVPGFLANRAKPGQIGYVHYRSIDWILGSALLVADGVALGDGSGRTMIESA